SWIQGTTSAPGHQPARSRVQVPGWSGTAVVAQSSRQMRRDTDAPPTAIACVRGQNSAQLSALPWPWPVTTAHSRAPRTPAGTSTVVDSDGGRPGSPYTTPVGDHSGTTACTSRGGAPARYASEASTTQPAPLGWPGPTQVSMKTRAVVAPARS